MSKVVVDIETVGVNFESLTPNDQTYLLKYAQTEEEKEDIKKKTGLYPLTGEVVTIAMLNPDTEKGMVFFQDKNSGLEKFEEAGAIYQSGSEKEILENFWNYIANFETVITFNGRSFDIPYIMLRSAINKVRCQRNLLGYRFENKIHCDLMDQLTFYGAVRKYNLDFYVKSFGIKSSKEEGVTGEDVGRLYAEKKYLEVARYCWRDVVATKELYACWNKYLRF